MTYPISLEGKFFKFRVPEAGQAPTDHVGLMHGEHSPAFCSVRSGFVGRARSGGASGGALPALVQPSAALTKPPMPPRPFQFTWVNYVRGGVAHAEIGKGVLTGKLSGCYVFTYFFVGKFEVAHVGTVDWETSKGSAQAKQAWLDFCEVGVESPIEGQLSLKPITIMGGSPSAQFTDDEKFAVALLGAGFPYVLSYTTIDGKMYSLLCYDAKPSDAPNPGEIGWIKVHSVREMTLQPWSAIKQLRTFRDIRVEDQAPNSNIIKGRDLANAFVKKR